MKVNYGQHEGDNEVNQYSHAGDSEHLIMMITAWYNQGTVRHNYWVFTLEKFVKYIFRFLELLYRSINAVEKYFLVNLSRLGKNSWCTVVNASLSWLQHDTTKESNQPMS